jgi:hypothetical protein
MADKRCKSDPIRQHWVPRFYLRYVATPETRDTENPLVWVFSKESGEPKLTSTRQIAAQSFLYSPKDCLGASKLDMEKELEALEAIMSPIWRIVSREFVNFLANEEIRKGLALFVSILHLRHPARLSEVDKIHEKIVAECEAMPTDNAGRPIIESVEIGGELRAFDNSGWHEYKAAGREEKKRIFVDAIRRNATHGAEILLRKRWYIVFSQKPVFMTTDTPVTVFNRNHKAFGLATPGTSIYFPLCPTRVLVMDDDRVQPNGLYHPLLDDTRSSVPFNKAAWHHAKRFMISPRHTDEVCAELLAEHE